MKGVKTIQNTSSIEQICLCEGEQYVLKPKEEKRVSAELADAFILQCQYVQAVEDDIGGEYEGESEDGYIYLANMTGDPEAPDEVSIKYYSSEHRSWMFRNIANPKKIPRDIRFKYDPGQEVYQDAKAGIMGKNLDPIMVKIPKYKVRKIKADLAKNMLRRDSNNEPFLVGSILKSRKPPLWRPLENWEFEEIRDWVELHNSGVDLGPTREDLREAASNDRELEFFVSEAKQDLLVKAHFVIANPKKKLFSKAEFLEWKAAKAAKKKLEEIKKSKKAKALTEAVA